jgi:hypothetical protein
VIVDGPGRVALVLNDNRVLYDRGLLQTEGQDPLGRWMAESVDVVLDHIAVPRPFGPDLLLGISDSFKCDPALWESHGGAFRKHARDHAPVLLGWVVRRIAKSIKDERHGGAVLVLPKAANPGEAATDARWFSAGGQDLQDAALRSAAFRSHLALALEGKWVIDNLRDEFRRDVPRWARDVINPQFERTVLNLDLACQRCARLAQVDGTTILRSDLRVAGFGARLTGHKPTYLPNSCEEFLKSRGTRHSSMAYTVVSIENTLGIVVSQDGNTTAFYKPAGMPLEHRELIV